MPVPRLLLTLHPLRGRTAAACRAGCTRPGRGRQRRAGRVSEVQRRRDHDARASCTGAADGRATGLAPGVTAAAARRADDRRLVAVCRLAAVSTVMLSAAVKPVTPIDVGRAGCRRRRQRRVRRGGADRPPPASWWSSRPHADRRDLDASRNSPRSRRCRRRRSCRHRSAPDARDHQGRRVGRRPARRRRASVAVVPAALPTCTTGILVSWLAPESSVSASPARKLVVLAR